MTLTNIQDLIGKPVKGIQADIRARHSDGSLYYPEQDSKRPRPVTLVAVKLTKHEEGRHNNVPWIYWRYHGYGCGMSGATVQLLNQQPHYIEIEAAQ